MNRISPGPTERRGRGRAMLAGGLASGGVLLAALAARTLILGPAVGSPAADAIAVAVALAVLVPGIAGAVRRLAPPASPAELWGLGAAWLLVAGGVAALAALAAGIGRPAPAEVPSSAWLWLLIPLWLLVGPAATGARRAREAGLSPIEPRLAFLPEERAADALAWLAGLLSDRGVRFAAVGGLAARAWGASRPLVDLDFLVSGEDLDRVEPELSPFVVRPLSAHRDDRREFSCLRLEYGGVPIELAVAEGARYREATTGEWHVEEIALARCPRRQVLGIPLPVLAKDDLLRLKRRLDRAIDRADVAALERRESTRS